MNNKVEEEMNYGRGRVLWRKRTCVLSTAEIFEILQNSPDLQKQNFIIILFRGLVGYVSCVVELFTMTSVVGGKRKKPDPCLECVRIYLKSGNFALTLRLLRTSGR